MRTEKFELAFEFEAGFRETIEPSPDEPIGRDYDGSQGDGAGEEKVEILGIRRGGNQSAYTNRRVGLAFKVEIFRDDACVPGAARSGDHPGHEKWKNSRENQFAPTLPSTDSKNVRRLF